jgi:phosphatidate cytidylyltransferase
MLVTRLMTAFVLLAVLLPALFWDKPWGFLALMSLALVAAAWEWGKMLRPQGLLLLPAFVGLVCLAAPDLFQIVQSKQFDPLTPLCYVISAFWIVYGTILLRRERSVKAGGAIIAGLVLVGAAAALVVLFAKGNWYLISCLLIVWVADTGAYFFGRAFGKHKLAPQISPGKTREGAIGACFAVAVYFVIMYFWFRSTATFPVLLIERYGLTIALVLALVLTGFSIVGDLIESKLKRECGVKDSGNTLPGHGGMLDRIDALLPVLPMCAVLS